jgi:Na+/H+ antiporter NhaD/arsenite permease-like protein
MSTPAPTNSTMIIVGSGQMSAQSTFFAVLVVVVFVALLLSLAPMFSILAACSVLLYLTNIISADDLFAGMVNNGVLAIAMLYVVVHPVVKLPLMKLLIKKILGSAKSILQVSPSSPSASLLGASANATRPEVLRLARYARLKICLLSLLVTPFLENTPQVAMFVPLVTEHCRNIGLAPSQILMPMTFAILLGNYATLGATSNLIIQGLMEKHGVGNLSFFELAKVNMPLLIPVLAYLVFAPRYLLPLRRGGLTFYSRMKITHGSPLIGHKISSVFQHFIQQRTEDTERIVLFRRHYGARNVASQKLAWEKVNEPFSRMLTIKAGDEIVVGGLVATIGADVGDAATTGSGSASEMEDYLAPSLGLQEATGSATSMVTYQKMVDEGASSPSPPAATGRSADDSAPILTEDQAAARAVEVSDSAVARSLNFPSTLTTLNSSSQATKSTSAGAPLAEIPIGSLERAWYSMCVAATEACEAASQRVAAAEGLAAPASPRSSTGGGSYYFPAGPAASSSPGAVTLRDPVAMIKHFCVRYSVMMIALKMNYDGADILYDEAAYAKSLNIARGPAGASQSASAYFGSGGEPPLSPRGKPVPQPGGGDHSNDAHSDSAEKKQQDGLERSLLVGEEAPATNKKDQSWAEWHQSQGGKLFSVHVPHFIPFGVPENLDDDDDPTLPLDFSAPTAGTPPVVKSSNDGQQKKVSKWRIVQMPWWYQYLSLGVFVGIVIASMCEVKLSVACVCACCACVLLRLLTAKELVKSLPVEVFLLVAFSFPLGAGMKSSGLSSVLGHLMVQANVTGIRLLYFIGAVTLILTNMITNQGCVQVMFPLVLGVYEEQKRHPLPGIIMLASTLTVALCTPFAIPSNALILVPGGYVARDFVKFGFPLSILTLVLLGLTTATVYDEWV